MSPGEFPFSHSSRSPLPIASRGGSGGATQPWDDGKPLPPPPTSRSHSSACNQERERKPVIHCSYGTVTSSEILGISYDGRSSR
ncbi:hypothetical protein DAI22_01g287150 [Oryza sativa Japonica Group]|nr:hypothetical protein DAI22_01g287150 [Oryza sativa Japonica Group]